MRSLFRYLIMIYACIVFYGCFKSRSARTYEERKIVELETLLSEATIKNEELDVIIAAKDRTISAQTTIIAAIDNGEKCLTAYQSQFAQLAGDFARLERDIDRKKTELSECRETWKTID